LAFNDLIERGDFITKKKEDEKLQNLELDPKINLK
tara:strand:+ start:665 stop:769 length:105 start_codon:yes stop_codon:yes gene_type:complete